MIGKKIRNFIRAWIGGEPSETELASVKVEGNKISMAMDSEVEKVNISGMLALSDPDNMPQIESVIARVSDTPKRENTYVTIKIPRRSPSRESAKEAADLVAAFNEGVKEGRSEPIVTIGDREIIGMDADAFRYPEYQREPIVPIEEIAALAAEFREKIKQQRRAFYNRKKSQAKNWHKWRP